LTIKNLKRFGTPRCHAATAVSPSSQEPDILCACLRGRQGEMPAIGPDDSWSAPADPALRAGGDGAFEFGGASARKAAHQAGGDAPRPSKAVSPFRLGGTLPPQSKWHETDGASGPKSTQRHPIRPPSARKSEAPRSTGSAHLPPKIRPHVIAAGMS